MACLHAALGVFTHLFDVFWDVCLIWGWMLRRFRAITGQFCLIFLHVCHISARHRRHTLGAKGIGKHEWSRTAYNSRVHSHCGYRYKSDGL
ncbi:hypothetical protein DER45DRAFT_195847 [Fusarium avenaceum]|nr:hypothetical protein DER45DRAFT_195847 [Fusarium avenaceum]